VGPPPSTGAATTSNTTTGKKNETSQPTPVGKAGFEMWVLTKGGLVSVHHCRLYCTVVHAHHVGRYASNPRVRACIGMVRSPKANFPTLPPRSFKSLVTSRRTRSVNHRDLEKICQEVTPAPSKERPKRRASWRSYGDLKKRPSPQRALAISLEHACEMGTNMART